MPRHFRGSGGGHSTFRPKRRRSSKKLSAFSDVSKFINKAIVTEAVERVAPQHLFHEFEIDTRLKKNIERKGYLQPTPIHHRDIPHALRGEDVVGMADTGTGKTAAFLIPLINKLILNPNGKVLIVVPTRELAFQIDEELRAFAKDSGLFSVICIGGAGIGRQ